MTNTTVTKKDLYDTNASLYVLSCLMRKPLLLQDDKYILTKTDFYKPLQQMVFGAIFNMAQNGVTVITPSDIDLYLKQFPSQYEHYVKNRGYEFVTQCYQTTEHSDENQFKYYYERLKKFSVLRDLEGIGVNTDSFYNTNKDALNRDVEDEKLNKTPLEAILNTLRNKLVDIENKHIGKDDNIAQDAYKGLEELIKQYEIQPEVGLPLDGDIMNFAARGARKGKLYTYSAPSGFGKTRFMLGNAASIAVPYFDKNGKIVWRGTIEEPDYKKVVFVATEQKPDEIQTMLLAFVSQVNEKKILLGTYTPEEKERIRAALDILKVFGKNFLIEYIPDPSIAMLKARLVKYIIQDDIEYIFYDYIFSSPGLLSEFRDVAVREDVALMMLSNSLKEIAASYNVFIQSATQLNDSWSKKEIGPRDHNFLRGSKAIADKIDLGIIGVRLMEPEKQQIAAIWTELQRLKPNECQQEPNVVMDIYKNRRGELNAVKIFRYFDFATCHCKDLFITDCSYKVLANVGRLEYELNKFDLLDLKSRGKL